jgi:beta-galactosidase
LVQNGNTLTGTVEGTGVSWAGGYDAPTPITDGLVDGTNLSFKAGNTAFSGHMNVDTIELERTPSFGPRPPRPAAQPEASRPAIGPPPDGSDPSSSPLRRPPGPVQVALHRVER